MPLIPLPKFFDGLNGPLIRTVSSLDTSVELFRTDPGTYTSMTKVNRAWEDMTQDLESLGEEQDG